MKKLEQHDMEQVAGAYSVEEISGPGNVIIIVGKDGRIWVF